MKKLTFALLAGLVLLIGACAEKGEEPRNTNGAEGPAAVLQINFDDDNYEVTRAVSDTYLLEATIFVLDKHNRIVKSFYEADMPNRSQTKEYKITTSARKVIIVGNAGDLTSITGYLTDLNAVTRKLDQMTDFDTKGIWMTGVSTETFNFSDTSSDPDLKLQKCNITMQLIPAKVTVIANNELSDATKAQLTIQEVAFLYSAQFTHLLPQRAQNPAYNDIYAPTFATVSGMSGAPAYYASGFLWNSPARGGVAYAPLKAAWDGSSQFSRTFYVLPGLVGDTNTKNAIVTIKTERTLQPSGTDTEYFSIFFNTSQKHVKQFLSSGKHYTLTLTLKDDPSGPEWPDIDNEAMISMHVNVADWVAVPISKIFE